MDIYHKYLPQMATIYIDNLIKPRQVNSPVTVPSTPVKPNQYVYNDLHLDLTMGNNVGNGLNPKGASDIKTDYDSQAIRNSISNIFNTLPGQKILNPYFGCNLGQFLFEKIDEARAKIIGNTILDNINRFEPRIQVLQIQVQPHSLEQLYYVLLVFKVLNIGVTDQFNLQFNSTGAIIL